MQTTNSECPLHTICSANPSQLETALRLLERIASALEYGRPSQFMPESDGEFFLWNARKGVLVPLAPEPGPPLNLIKGAEEAKALLLDNTRRFATGYPANNAMLWGARGTGKSSLVKAVHAETIRQTGEPLCLVEIGRDDVESLQDLLLLLRTSPRRFIVFCDDLSFDFGDPSYKALKSALDGGLSGRPRNVLFYVTSNRRHLVARSMIENEQSTAIHQSEAVEESVSLSDRFGLWIGFHGMDMETYLDIVAGYAQRFSLSDDLQQLHVAARQWAMARGSRSGRVAWQFIQAYAGEKGIAVNF